MLPAPALPASGPYAPWFQHPTLSALQPSLQNTADCWALLAAPVGTRRKEHYLPKGEREPETAYRKRSMPPAPAISSVTPCAMVPPWFWFSPPSTAGPERVSAWRPCAGLLASPTPECSLYPGPTF